MAAINAPKADKLSQPTVIELRDEKEKLSLPSRPSRNDVQAPNKRRQEIDDDDSSDAGSDDSLLIDILNSESEIKSDDAHKEASADTCTPVEASAFRKRLHEVGLNRFVEETISAQTISAQKLCTAFVPAEKLRYFEGSPDEGYLRLLGLALIREIQTRQKLPQYNTLDDVVSLLTSRQRILVITGAGISTNLGIPDFRSKNTGFYAKMREKGFESGEDVFSIDVFDEDPSTFYENCGDTFPKIGVTSPTHAFIALLQNKGKLLTNYTQNIDNIEANAGIRPDKLIQCHGSWATATCRKCSYQVPGQAIFEDVKNQKIPVCPRCVEQLKQPNQKRKRKSRSKSRPQSRRNSHEDSTDDEEYDIPQPGVMKPDITFFGEKLPEKFFERFKEHDRKKVDLVIVIGTSMKVAPVSEIPMALDPQIPHVYISRDHCPHINFDVTLLGDCDTIVAELSKRANWNLEHPMVRPSQAVELVTRNKELAIWDVQVKA